MKKNLSETEIVQALAESVCQRVSRKTIRALQGIANTDSLLSGEESGLVNVWEEICVQLQYEESFFWDAYLETIQDIVESHLIMSPDYELEAIWLQTTEGQYWNRGCDDDREPYPVSNDEITNYVIDNYVFSKGNDWSNPRIRAYLNRSYLD
jgi:hypothetical protein